MLKHLSQLVTVAAFGFISFNACGQKFPNVQEANLRAPENIKIDGKATEWKDSLQAYNKATQIYYTVSNDDENLYLTVMAAKPRVITKIIDVGITFMITRDGKKNSDAKDNISLTYPVLELAPAQQILLYAGSKVRPEIALPPALIARDTAKYSNTHTDSLILIANKALGINAKNIKIKGIPAIADTLLSVYNEERVRAAARFGKSGVYTYELAVPLRYLGLHMGDTQKFNYSIRLESRLTMPKHGLTTTYIYTTGEATDIDQDLDSTTDLWGTYVLAAK